MMKKTVITPVFTLAALLLFGFIGWALAGHGTLGLLRVTPVFLYFLVFIGVLGLILIGLFLWYMLNRRGGRKLAVTILALSIICILLFPYAFILLGVLPPSGEIEPVPQLSVPAAEGRNLHFAVGSDAHFGSGDRSPAETAAMLSQISSAADKYNAFFYLGDAVEYGFRDSQWKTALNAFSPVASRVPTRFAPGNHDTLFGGLKRYLAYCRPPPDESGDSGLWYRVDAGNVHFLVLDVEWSAETFTAEQAAWLETQLKSIPAGDWKIVLSHGFYYASGVTVMGWHWYDNPETISALTPLFEKYGVDMVFSGHDHYLEFLQHAGVSYVVCGGFGGKLDPAPTYLSPASVWRQPGQFGFAEVSIDAAQAVLSFRAPDGSVLKSFTISKR